MEDKMMMDDGCRADVDI